MRSTVGKIVGFTASAMLMLACTGEVGRSSGKGSKGDLDLGGDASGGRNNGGGASGSDPSVERKAQFQCKSGEVGADAPLRRLTSTQYRNMIRDLVSFTAKDAVAETLSVVEPLLAKVPEDDSPQAPDASMPHTMRRLDQVVDDLRIQAYYDVSRAAGDVMGANRTKVLGTCASDSVTGNDTDCLSAFITSFGERALRRPLTATDRGYFLSFSAAGITAKSVSDLVVAILFAPEVASQVELGGAAVGTNRFTLTAHEVASRLSFHYLQSMPDNELWEAARSGKILDEQEFRRQVKRLAGSQRAKATFDEFFTDYLQLGELRSFVDKENDVLYRAFASRDLPSPNLRENMIEEALDLTRHHLADNNSKFSDLFTTERSFARTADVAKLYGVDIWDGKSEPPMLPPGHRIGILGRAAFLASASATTNPIMKGVKIRRTILCDSLGPPPPGVAVVPIPTDPEKSARQMATARTEPAPCSVCHSELINPLGFLTEGFDGLGRFRSEEPLYSNDGTVLRTVPVDDRAVPQVLFGDTREVQGLPGLVDAILESGKAESCFARHYLRFAMSRWEDDEQDGCLLEHLRKVAAGGGSMREVLESIALDSTFRQRIVGPTN